MSSDDDAADIDAVVKFLRDRDISETYSADENEEMFRDSVFQNYRVKQYVQSVVDFSSQYGSEYSISYTAMNIIGRPSQYPGYGDYPETFAMRTYGDWWNQAPSRIKEIQPQNLPEVVPHDFIVVTFESFILPEEIIIFETFNPGAVIRIWAYTFEGTWICLWETKDFYKHPPCFPNRSRKFTLTLDKINRPTKTIRLEFNHTYLNYFTEIDAVMLCGKSVNMGKMQIYEQQRNGFLMRKLQSMQFRPYFKKDCSLCMQDFLVHDLNKFVAVLSKESETSTDSKRSKQTKSLSDIPFEILLNVFSYLDLVSLFHVGQVSRYFYDVSTHPSLYTEINLKPYWHSASIDLLCTLAKRSTMLKKLDLSWCGLFNSITSTEFKKFIQQRGDNLTHLRLNSCKFLNATCIDTIGIVCDNLKELTLRNYPTDQRLANFSCLANLKNLERLDLFHTALEQDLLLTILEGNRKLKHLNLAFCAVSVNMDEVAQHISIYNRQLVSLDMWKSHFLSGVGLLALSNCRDLEELDVGWCLREDPVGDSLRELLTNCTKIKKLFLTAVRGLTDSDIENIGNLCSNLEQLELVGVMGISKERYYDILRKCPKLKLLDLSFSNSVDKEEISTWARTFKVNIKNSSVGTIVG